MKCDISYIEITVANCFLSKLRTIKISLTDLILCALTKQNNFTANKKKQNKVTFLKLIWV